MTITVQGTTFQSSVGTPWNIPAGVAMFVQAGSGGTVLDYDATRQRYMAEYGVDPLGQVTPDPNAVAGTAAYDLSREYYLNNPSQRFQDLTAQYAQQHGSIVGSSGTLTPVQQATFQAYNTPATEQMVAEKSAQLGALYAVGGITAAGLQAGVSELSRQYNYTTQSLGNIAESATSYVNAFKNTLLGSEYTVEQTGSGGAGYTAKIINSAGVPISLQEAAINSAILGGLTTTNSDLYTIKGEFGTINKIEDAKLRIDPLTGEVGIYTKNNLGQWALSGGIGRYGAQSGEYTIINENTGKSLNLAEISPLWTENLGKVSAPGANIPWSLASGASGLGTVTEKGLGTSFSIENAANITPSISKLTGAVSSAALAATNPETYTIEGKFGDVSEITGAKIIYNPLTGEAGIYSQRNAIAGMKSSGNQWALTAGIGMYGGQSGEYTIINEQTGQKTNLASLVEPAISQSNKQYAVSLLWNIGGWSAGLSEAVNGTISGISSATKGTTTVMPVQIAAAEPTTVVKAAGSQQTGILDQVGSFLSGAVNFWTPSGITGTKNVVEGSVPIAGDIPYIGSTINSVASWITPQGMAQVTTPAGLQVQKDASAALSNVQTIKAQYDVAKGQYDTDIAAARAAGYINAQGEITDSKTYAKLSGEIDAVNVLSGKLNEANVRYTSVYDTAVKEGLYTVDKSGNYIPTTKAQSSAMDRIDLWASPILKGAGFEISTDYSKIEQKPVIQTPLYDIYQSFEKNFAQPFTLGAATEVQEKPASAAFNFAVGVGLALATEGFGSVVARSATLSRVGGVVSPTIYTTRAGTEIGLVPAALSGIYAASVPYRATDELTNFEPKEVSKNLGGILATETGPMIAGAYLGTEAYVRAAPAISRGATQFSDWISTPSGGWREEAVFSPGGVGGRTIQVGEAEKTTPFTKEEFIKTFDVPVSVQTYAESMGLNLEQAAYLSEQLGARGGNVFGSSGISELVGSGELSLEPPAGYRSYMKSRLQESGAITPSLGAIGRIPTVSENLPVIDINLKGVSEYSVPTINKDYYTQMKYTQRLEPVTATERNMIITQYELTPIEIETAKIYGQTLNDVLAYREYTAALKEPVLVQKAELSDLALRQDVKFGSTGKYATEIYPELADVLSSRKISGTESYLLSRGILPTTMQGEIFAIRSILGTDIAQASSSRSATLQSEQQVTLSDLISETIGKQATAQTERQAQREAQVTDQSIIQNILGKQIVTPDITQDILGKQITTPVPGLSILTGITLPKVTEVPPVEPVKVERPPPPKINWPDLSDLKQGGAWGSGKLTGTVFTERLQLKSMRQVLGGIMPKMQQQKRKR